MDPYRGHHWVRGIMRDCDAIVGEMLELRSRRAR
jgi:hypothetical protein